nr:MAG TPA: hypothetical protein [Caudoviricetes sp.]
MINYISYVSKWEHSLKNASLKTRRTKLEVELKWLQKDQEKI